MHYSIISPKSEKRITAKKIASEFFAAIFLFSGIALIFAWGIMYQ